MSLDHTFVYFGYLVAIIVLTLFGLDLATGIPLKRASLLYSATNVICGGALGYLSWNVHRDLP